MALWPRWFAIGLVALSLLPLASLGVEWVEYRRTVGLPLTNTPPQGFDGVRWVEGDGGVRAAYVTPMSSGARAGLEVGDRLVAVDAGRVRTVEDVERQVSRATGTVLGYDLERRGRRLNADVRVDRYPTFLYPLSGSLWAYSLWGFGLVGFFHLLAFLTVSPLARRSPRAQRSKRLIAAALAWVGINWVRLGWVALLGPPPAGVSLRGAVFDALTLTALAGWIVYPALLLDQSLRTRTAIVALGRRRWVLAVPTIVLGAGVTVATLTGRLGPLPPDAFVVPILFYVCVYVAGATAVTTFGPALEERAGPGPRWSRIGSLVVLATAIVGAILVTTRLGPSGVEDDVQTAWFIVSFQLLSLLPVALVSFATLRHGSFDVLLARGVATLATLGIAFGTVAVGDAVLDALMPSGSEPVALGVLVVAILLMVERGSPVVREWSQRAFESSRQRARKLLDRFGDRLRTILDVDQLALEAVQAVGSALDVRSAVVFLQAARQTPDERWVRAAYRPEAPTFTQADLDAVWEKIRNQGRVWSRNEELNEATLPLADSDRLARLGVALAVPVTTGPGIPVGLIALGRKERRLAVYDVEDVERMRAVAAQLAVAVERIRLLDRERALVRQTADAEMAALRAQINPHFLFNALNTVAALIRDRPDEAEETVENLAALFRDVLNASGQAEVSLRDEIRLVTRYLSVEEARFRDALEVEIDVPATILDLKVPAFGVQTLVENAVKHGIEKKRGGGAVTVIASRTATRLRVAVTDTGAGLPPAGATFGVGLSNVADRLRLLYGDAAAVQVDALEVGARATLDLPISHS